MSNPIGDIMQDAMDKIHGMVDSDTVIGRPITTEDGITLIPISRMSFGFASGGSDKKDQKEKGSVWGGSGAAVKMDPIGFLMLKDGTARMVSIQPPAYTTAERVIDMVPEIMDKIERYVDRFSEKAERKAEEKPDHDGNSSAGEEAYT